MAGLTKAQVDELQSLRELLVETRTRLERLNLSDSIASVVWARLSNAHAALGQILENDRIQNKGTSKGTTAC
jgi:hypothetical protein